ncbi:MAG: DNA primase [Candidatus Omnitrophica bacterium]|nr:DNA primase [Candidatus Omnitrophota bacterium]
MSGIPEHIIEQIHERVDIVEVIGSYIPLRKAGRNYKAACPFHHEKTPSFMVSQEKQIFHCFGCGVGGNVFNFLMKYERLEFPEAVRMLAQKAGVIIPSQKMESKEERPLINSLYAVNELATSFFQRNLKEDRTGRAAHDYLIKRGLSEEMIKIFRLGFATSRWDGLLNFAKQKGISPDILEKAGLIILKGDGTYFDRFRSRIMFPIIDMKSRILGFGGRVFLKEDEGPKYMNSPETLIYNKSRNLYCLTFTWKHIRDEDKVIIVEGYLDLIIPFQYGIKNIVASLGTSLTQQHVRILRRYTKNAVVIFDPDKAGELATLRSLDLMLEEGLNVGVVRLSEGFDPDSFIRKDGAEEFRKRIVGAKNLFEYKMSLLLSKYNKARLEDKAKIVEEMLPTISKVANAVLKAGYIKSLADSLGVDEEAIKEELKKVRQDYIGSRLNQISAGIKMDVPSVRIFRQSEKILAGLLIDDNNCIKSVKEKISAEEFQDSLIRKIMEVLFRCSEESKTVTPGKLINYLDDAEAHKLIPELVDVAETIVDKQKTLFDCIVKIKQDNLKEKLNRLQVEIALAQSKDDEDKINKLIAECNELVRGIKAYEGKAKEALQKI